MTDSDVIFAFNQQYRYDDHNYGTLMWITVDGVFVYYNKL